jgi:hypothetical protein
VRASVCAWACLAADHRALCSAACVQQEQHWLRGRGVCEDNTPAAQPTADALPAGTCPSLLVCCFAAGDGC